MSFVLNALQLSQKRDRLEGQDSLPMKIKGWIPIKKVQLPPKPDSEFEWFHLIEDSDTFKSNRNLCCHYFMLDMTDKSQKSKFLFWCFSVPFFPHAVKLCPSPLPTEKYDGSLTHIVPTLVTMVDSVQSKLDMVCTYHMESKLPFQVSYNIFLYFPSLLYNSLICCQTFVFPARFYLCKFKASPLLRVS